MSIANDMSTRYENPIASQPCLHLVLAVFLILATLVGMSFTVVLIKTS